MHIVAGSSHFPTSLAPLRRSDMIGPDASTPASAGRTVHPVGHVGNSIVGNWITWTRQLSFTRTEMGRRS